MARLAIARPEAGAGLAWVKSGWHTYRQAAVVWSGMTAAAYLLIVFVHQIPLVGPYLVELLSPFLVAGFMSAGRSAERSEPVTFLNLGAGFQTAVAPLAVVGGVYLLGTLLADQAMRAVGGQGLHELMQLAQPGQQQVKPEEAKAILSAALPALLLGMLLLTPTLMATWFAPALVLFDAYRPGNAMWWSLWTCAVNWRPILVYTLALGAVGFLAMLIPYGLGLLVFLPWAMISTYAAYRSLYIPARSAPE